MKSIALLVFVVSFFLLAKPARATQVFRSPLTAYEVSYETKPKIKYNLVLQTPKQRFESALAVLGASQREIIVLTKIARAESQFDAKAKNKSSSASGILQYLVSTWNYQCSGSIWNIEHQAKCGLNDIRKGRINQWAVVKHLRL